MSDIRIYHSPVGNITLAADCEGLVGIWFEGQKHFGSTLHVAEQPEASDYLDETERWLDMYFSGDNPGFTPKLHMIGTEFQKSIWMRLLTIPYGATTSYGTIAREAGSSARAVAGAVARNPVSIIVPCHRVIASDGTLAGYAGGLSRKEALLRLERGL